MSAWSAPATYLMAITRQEDFVLGMSPAVVYYFLHLEALVPKD